MNVDRDATGSATTDKGGGFFGSLGHGMLAGAFVGALWGAIETLVRVHYYGFGDLSGKLQVPAFGVLDGTAAVVLSALDYGVLGAGVGLLGALVLVPVLSACFPGRGSAWSVFTAPRIAALFVAIFFNLYWWSRFVVGFAYSERFYSPKRLLLAAGLAVAALAVAWLVTAWLGRHRRVGLRLQNASLLLLAVLAVGFLTREQLIRAAQPDKADAAGRVNVVLFIIDTLRADHLGSYGYVRDTTPRIDQLAREGILFERCVAQAPYTWTSFGSIFTGLYPRKHGLVKMDPTLRFDPRQNVTLQRILDDAGYRTGAFMTGMISSASGLLAGFQDYFEETVGRRLVHRGSVWSDFRSELVVHALLTKLSRFLDPALVANQAIAWLDDHGDSRFLAVVHLFSTHTPYDPPEAFDVFSTPERKQLLDKFTTFHARVLEQGQATFDDQQIARVIDLYDGGALFADAMVGSVIDELERQGLLDETVVIVTSDHGEELGERGLWEHDWMFNTNQLVPLVVRMPGGAGAGTRVSCPVETIDILPTVLEICGLPPQPDIDGRSLVPWIEGGRPQEDDFAFCENNFYVSVQQRDWKLIKNRFGDPNDPPRLYHLAADPLEFRDLFDERPEQAARLLKRLQAYDSQMPVRDTERFPADPETLRQLEQLGYMNSGRPLEGPAARKETQADD